MSDFLSSTRTPEAAEIPGLLSSRRPRLSAVSTRPRPPVSLAAVAVVRASRRPWSGKGRLGLAEIRSRATPVTVAALARPRSIRLPERSVSPSAVRRPGGGSSSVSQKRCPRRSQPAAHTHSGTVSVRVPDLPSAAPISQSSHLGAPLLGMRMLSCCVYLPPASPPFAAIRHSHDQS